MADKIFINYVTSFQEILCLFLTAVSNCRVCLVFNLNVCLCVCVCERERERERVRKRERERWMNGWMDGWMNKQTDGRDHPSSAFAFPFKFPIDLTYREAPPD